MEYVLKYLASENTTKPWTVLGRQVGADYWQQVAPWYAYKGNAERKLRQLRGEK